MSEAKAIIRFRDGTSTEIHATVDGCPQRVEIDHDRIADVQILQ